MPKFIETAHGTWINVDLIDTIRIEPGYEPDTRPTDPNTGVPIVDEHSDPDWEPTPTGMFHVIDNPFESEGQVTLTVKATKEIARRYIEGLGS